ncbi:hypothetical protein T484DRAFT_2600240 [Baffinella frigidus]|nr:hypothetical protein T484DRAFT_2600240 [Cryptophyta sp. CCMP2293]
MRASLLCVLGLCLAVWVLGQLFEGSGRMGGDKNTLKKRRSRSHLGNRLQNFAGRGNTLSTSALCPATGSIPLKQGGSRGWSCSGLDSVLRLSSRW